MELRNLKVCNFRGIDEKMLNPGKVNVIYGPNGSGKSSILDAISFLLTGKAGANVVKEGALCAEVSASVMGVPVYRKGGSKTVVKMDGKATSAKSLNQFFENAIGATPDTLKVASSSGMLAAMNSRELSSFLVNNNLIPVDIDMEVLTMLCSISKPALVELENMLPPAPVKFSMAEIEDAYKHYFAVRPLAKKAIADKKLIAEKADTPPMFTLKQVDDELAAFNAYEAKVESFNRMMRMYNTAVEKRNTARATLAQLDAQIAENKAKPVDPNELSFLNSQRERFSSELMACNKKWQVIKSNLDMFQRTLDSLDKPVCPISNKLICTTDKTAIRQELSTLVAKNTELLNELTATINEHGERIKTFDARIKDFYARQSAYGALEALIAKRAAVEANIPELPEKPVAPAQIPNATERIATLKEQRRAIFAYEDALAARKELPALEANLAVIEELCNLLAPKGGVREQIVSAAFEPLIEHCNERAAILKPDFQIGLVADDGIHITCKPQGVADMLPLDAVSAGEQLTCMLLMLDAINALSGLGLLVLDDLDKLDATALDAMFTMLADPTIRDSYDHIFVAMVNHEDSLAIIKKHAATIDVAIDLSK